jgi:hypothetical protein
MANTNDTNEDDRPVAALLSNAQREWLAAGAPEPMTDAHHSLRQRIRKRLRQSLADFALLGELPESDLENVLQNPTSEQIEGMTAALRVIWLGTRDGPRAGADFESLLKQAIRRAEYDPDDRAPVWWAVEVLFEHDHIIVNKPALADIDLEEIGKKISEEGAGDVSHAELALWADYYKLKGDEFDHQFPARMSELPGTVIGEEEQDTDE